MRGWLKTAICLLCLTLSSTALAGKLVIYDRPPMQSELHPFLLLGSRQGVLLSALVSVRAARMDTSLNRMELSLFETAEKRGSREYDLILRQGLKWSDGSPLTAKEVANSFARLEDMISLENPPLAAQVLYRLFFLIERVDAPADDKARFIFRKPVNVTEIPSLLAMYPIIPSKLTNKQLSEPGAVGGGPFVITAMDEGIIRLSANPYYYLGKPKIDEIEYRILSNDDITKALFAENTGDMAVFVPRENLDRIKKRPDLVVRPTKSRRVLYLGFNRQSGSVIARYSGLRMVLASILNRQAIEDTLSGGVDEYSLLTGPYAQDGPYADPDVMAPPISAPIASKRLADLDFRRIGETYRDASGKALSFRLLACSTIYKVDLIIKMMTEQLERMGIGLQVEMIDEAGFQKLLLAPRGDYDLILHEWVLDEGEDIYEIYHSTGLYNYLGYSNLQVDERLVLERRAALPKSRILYRQELHRLFSQDMPALFFWESHDVAVFRTDVEKVPPLDPYFLFRDIHLWTVGGEGDSS